MRRDIIISEIDRLERLAVEIYENTGIIAEYIWQWIERYARMLEMAAAR